MLESGSWSERESDPARFSRKPMLLLDTNYLSNLARVRLEACLSPRVMDAWKGLLDALVQAVWDDRLACPGFNVQVEELEMDDRIAGPALVVLRSLSLGLAFRTLDGIVARQVEDVALRWLQRPPVEGPPWRQVMQDDPDTPAIELSRRMRTRPFPFALSDQPTVGGRREAAGRGGTCNGLAGPMLDLVLRGSATESRLAFARFVIGRRLRDALAGGSVPVSSWPIDTRFNEWTDMASRLRSAGMTLHECMAFLDSPWPAHVPYVDLYCTLARAAALETSAGRPDQTSDEADRCIVAALLPYCGLVTTDRFVKHLVTTGLRLDARYGCQVFSGRVEDVKLLTGVVDALPPVEM